MLVILEVGRHCWCRLTHATLGIQWTIFQYDWGGAPQTAYRYSTDPFALPDGAAPPLPASPGRLWNDIRYAGSTSKSIPDIGLLRRGSTSKRHEYVLPCDRRRKTILGYQGS